MFSPVRRIAVNNLAEFSFSPLIKTINYSTATLAQFQKFTAAEKAIEFVKEEVPENLNENDVHFEMKLAPIHPSDINIIQGVYGVKPQLPAVAGTTGFAQVKKVGSGVTKFKEHDRVIPFKQGYGTWRTEGVLNSEDFIKVPVDIDPIFASVAAINPATALRLLEDFQDLVEGDVIIQNGGTSMVATSVMQIAHLRGIKTISIIQNRPDFDTVVETLKNHGAFIVVSEEFTKTSEFRKILDSLPKPKLALNCVGGESVTAMARALKEDGTLVTYGAMTRRPITIPGSHFIFRNISARGFWLHDWYQKNDRKTINDMFETLFEMSRNKAIRVWLEHHKFSELGAAITRSQQPWKNHKTLLQMDK